MEWFIRLDPRRPWVYLGENCQWQFARKPTLQNLFW